MPVHTGKTTHALCVSLVLVVMILLRHVLQVNVYQTSGRALGDWAGYMNRLWGMPAGMLIGVTGNTLCHRKMGNIII